MRRLLHKTPTWIQKLYPSFVWQVPTREKVIYLTFDDGPVPEITEYVMDELKKFQAKATFFCVGENILKHPHIARQVVEQGHVIGNHTHNHLKGWQTGNFKYWKNVLTCDRAIQTVQETKPLFRPPYGRITRTQARALSRYNVVMWNRLAWDFEKNLNTEVALKHLLDDAPGGSIFVFHDNAKAYHNLKVLLPEVLRHYSEKGYSFQVLG